MRRPRSFSSLAIVWLVMVVAAAGGSALAYASAASLDQVQTISDDSGFFGYAMMQGQTFTAGATGNLDRVDLNLSRAGAPGGVTIQIRTVSAGEPSDTVIGSGSIAEGSVSDNSFDWVSVHLDDLAWVISGKQYAIVLFTAAAPPCCDGYKWALSFQNPYAGGTMEQHIGNNGSWTPLSAVDFTFKTYVIAGVDDTPPTITTSDVTVNATSPDGAWVPYVVTATDNLDQNPTVACFPPPNTLFAIGDTTVNCTATDEAGNSTPRQFTVHVSGAGEQLVALINAVDGYGLGKLGTSLHDKLVTVQRMLAAGKKQQACDNLTSFISQVKAQNGKGLSTSQVNDLTGRAQLIKTVIGC